MLLREPRVVSNFWGKGVSQTTEDRIVENRTNTENKLLCCGMFLELKKAFDIVDHSILLHRLYDYGIRDIVNDWFSSYFCNRFRETRIDSYISNKGNISCGVPQGAFLVPSFHLYQRLT